MSSGERPIGAAKGKQTNTMASCQPLPPPPLGASGQCIGGRGVVLLLVCWKGGLGGVGLQPRSTGTWLEFVTVHEMNGQILAIHVRKGHNQRLAILKRHQRRKMGAGVRQ